MHGNWAITVTGELKEAVQLDTLPWCSLRGKYTCAASWHRLSNVDVRGEGHTCCMLVPDERPDVPPAGRSHPMFAGMIPGWVEDSESGGGIVESSGPLEFIWRAVRSK